MEGKFTHSALNVTDMERSLRFYCEGLGFEAAPKEVRIPGVKADEEKGIKEIKPFRFRFLRKDGMQLELVDHGSEKEQGSIPSSGKPAPNAAGERPKGFSHLTIKTPEVMGLAKRLEEYGANVDWDSKMVFPLKDDKVCLVLFLTDPDGVRIELNDLPFIDRFAS